MHSFKIYGKWSVQASKQSSKHTHACAQWSHASVGLAQARPNKLLAVSWASGRCGHMIKCLLGIYHSDCEQCKDIVLTITNSRSKAMVAVHKLLAARMTRQEARAK